MRKILFILLSFVVLLSTFLIACNEEEPATTTSAPTTTQSPTSTSKPTSTTTVPVTTTAAPAGEQFGGIYKTALTVAPARPIGYPAEAAPDSYTAAEPAVERLIRIKEDGSIDPRLAVSWEVADDKKSLLIGLRQGVKFHDGSDFNAEVCKWNLDLQIEAGQSVASAWTSIDIVDEYTIRINLAAWQNTALTGLAGGGTQQVSKEFVEKNGIEAARWNPVGTGAFIFESYERDAKIIYKRNPDYWDAPKPYLDGVTMTIVADATVRKLAFQKGEIFSFQPSSLLDGKELDDTGLYQVRRGGGGPYILIPDSMNPESPWADPKVRFAASYGLDRETLAEGLGYGFATPSYQLFQSFPELEVPGLIKTTYDPGKTSSLLKEAGYPNGFKTVIHAFTRIVPQNYIVAVAEQLREVDIDVETDFPTSGKYSDMRYGTWDGLMGHGMAVFDNKNSDFSFYFTGLQFQYCKKPAGWEEGLAVSLSADEPDNELIKNIIQIMYDDMMVIPYMEQQQFMFRQKGVNDDSWRDFSPLTTNYKHIWLDKSLR